MPFGLLKSLKVLLLFALIHTIICASSEMFTKRRDRSSYIDTSLLASDNLGNTESNTNEHRSRRPTAQVQRQSHAQLRNQQKKDKYVGSESEYRDAITSIFHVGPEDGLILFNTSLRHPTSEPIHGMQADDAFTDQSSEQEQPFKVQRSPDGKLNLVFNDFLFFQTVTEPQRTHTINENRDAIIFPGQAGYVPHLSGIEPYCDERIHKGKSFCTKVPNYPAPIELDSILRNEISKFEVFFGEDLVQPTNVTQRMNNEPDEEELCKSKQDTIFPEAGETRDSSWMLIVNNKENYKQGVRIEECLNEGSRCEVISNSLPNHYTATCKQSYTYRSLVAITSNHTVTKGHFKMPSCCKCVLRNTRN